MMTQNRGAGRSRRLAAFGANVGLVFVSLVLIVVMLELYVHAMVDDGMQYDLEMWKYARELKVVSDNPEIGHEHRPDSRARLMGVDVAINALGFRDDEIDLVVPEGRVRIVSLGDSITFGWGVPQDETFSQILETELRARGQDVEVINLGVGNYNTTMEVAAFLEHAAILNPDIVLLNYFINDTEMTPEYQTSFIERHSRAWTFFSARLDIAARELGLGSRTDWQSYYEGLYDPELNPNGWDNAAAAIRDLAAWCREHGVSLRIANFPELRVLDPYPFEFVGHRVERLAEDLSVPYLDLLDAVRGEDPATLWVTVPDPHPNARANHLFGLALADWFDMLNAVSVRDVR